MSEKIDVKTLFDKKYDYLIYKDKIDIDDIVKDEELTIICADFYGIQNFIFENVPSSKAYKVLRAKSAYVQIFTKVLAKYIVELLDLEEKNIIFSEAGKIEILSIKVDDEKIEQIQKELDEHFIKEFFALAGVNLISINTSKASLKNPKEFKALREKLDEKLEFSKFHKFDLQNQNTILEQTEMPTNQTLCKTCGIRKVKDNSEVCKTCDKFITLGQELTTKNSMKISKEKSDIDIFQDYFISFKDEEDKEYKSLENFWKIKSYVKADEYGMPYSFDDLAKKSKGAENIAILKGDVDSLGNFIKDKSNALDSYENYIYLAQTLNNFFTIKVKELLEKDYKNTYVVFTGGDDFFIIGAWNEIIKLVKDIYKEFKIFTSEKLTLSVGVMLSKANVPISYMHTKVEELLDESKRNKEKDSITLFSQTVTWQEYIQNKDTLYDKLENMSEEDKKSAFFYNLLELIEMSIRLKEKSSIDIKDAMWKSKLNYSFRRNIKNQDEELFKVLNEQIEKNPKATKMIVSEFIYKRRD
ncbi:type III-A CRISPR-associated protein Cas10/Csm1 [Malaciobacter canalis]|uniref:type III-A CRISPR-associated protein Cas10/Csm1 n=1 Tax=Malaciobacter canalis TaxID=1912871 RepID=UPI003850F706